MKKLAGSLLNYLHLIKFNTGRMPNFDEVLKESNLKKHQLESTFEYCKGLDYLTYRKTFGGIIAIKLLSKGVELVGDENNFKRAFEISLVGGVPSLKWRIEDK